MTYTWNEKKKTWDSTVDTRTAAKTRKDKQLKLGKNYTYRNTEGGIYLGSDGIRFGSAFHVSPSGMYALAGEIGGIKITQDGLSASHWKIDGSGNAYFTNAYINGSDIVSCTLSGKAGGTGVSGGGMRMGSGGAGSSYMSPQVKTGDNGQQTWEDYIKKYIESSMTKDKIIKALLNGGDTISFGQNVTVTAETFNGQNMKKAGTDLAT